MTAAAPLVPHPGRAVLARVLRRIGAGSLTVVLPGGARARHAGAEPGPEAVLVLHRWRALRRLLSGGDIGFAEAYVDGDWSSPDPVALLELAARNMTRIPGAQGGALPVRIWHRLRHLARANSRRGSRRNIMSHYDLGNDFYAHWLDAGMSYSSGLYRNPGTDPVAGLADAQAAKQDRVMELLDLAPGQRLLEIGCGWGGLAARLAAAGAQVTGLTLSPSQLGHAIATLTAAGLDSRVDLRLQDYRDATGSFDRIVSVEMIEAVGESYWPTYFETLRARLAPGGVVVLQAITIADAWFESYRRGADFIQHAIFPGGMLPSPDVIAKLAERHGLTISCRESFGDSYARTLAAWRARFHAAWPAIAAMGFPPRFRRLWDYYLAYCEAGFRAGRVDVGLWRLEPR
ncbi:MAG: class I SAM-dependent methyltransferase [Rhodospirillales bacterium]|jgi:cyclopropane-fatty-acyl-phospholipid synthase|nr:class I SAM-dependent methyltransferase [Rhodospirillales bacterium]